MHDAHNLDDLFVLIKAVEQEVLFKLREGQDP
jgi:cold shock CspA family protein